MNKDKKKPDTSPAAGVDTAAEETTDLDAVMRKYDRESATRMWEGTPQLVIRVLMALFGVFCIVMTLFSKDMPEIRLTLFVGCIVIIGFLTYPASKHHVRVNYLPWYDIVLMLVGAGCFFYFALNAMALVRLSTRIEPVHVIIGVVGILILMELCRRCVGVPILCVAGALIIYAFINQLSYADGVNAATLYDALKTIIYKLFYTTSGVIGTPINVCYTYIVLFIIFGAFLERTGIANFFISFANRIAGWSSGGPAKVAVISSALCGMVSGSSVGNTVTTGSFTIPMMKKTGYKPEFAGAVEAAASTGGQIRIGASDTICRYFLVPYLEQFHKAFPGTHIKVTNATSIRCVELLRSGQVDLIVVNFPNSHLDSMFTSTTIHEFQDVFIADETFKELRGQKMSYQELLKYPILMLDKNSTTSEYLHALFQQHQLDLVPEVELSSNDLLIDLARIGLGIACIPDYCLKHESKDLFILKTLEPLPRRQLAVSVNPNLPILTSTEEFLNLLPTL